MLRVAPSLLSSHFGTLARDARDLAEAGADWLHFDVMDGHFVPNLTFGAHVVEALRPETDLYYDVHLMVESPSSYVQRFAAAGANGLTIHYEATRAPHRVLRSIREHGVAPGLSLCPATPVEALSELVDEIDTFLIMSVDPGFGGQAFIESAVGRIQAARTIIDRSGRDVRLAVDGGIDGETAKRVVSAGADVLIAGSAVFGHSGGYTAAIAELRAAGD